MTRKRDILLDCDGVLSDFHTHYVHTAALTLGRIFDMAVAHTQWSVQDALGLSAEEQQAVVARIWEPGWVRYMPVLPGAQSGVQRLREAGHTLHIVTAPWKGHPSWTFERELWLQERFGFESKDVTHTHRKDLVRGDVFVDDKPAHVMAWQQAYPHGLAILWGAPYNKGALSWAVSQESARNDFWPPCIGTWDGLLAHIDRVHGSPSAS